MSELTDEQKKTLLVEDIMSARFGRFWNWSPPVVENHIGPYFPEVWSDFEAKVDKARRDSLHDTNLLSLSELQARYCEEGEFKRQLVKGDAHSNSKGDEPHWWQGGFGNSKNAADIEYWGRIARFSFVEAACVTIGFDPKHYDEKHFKRHNYHPVIEFFLARLEMIRREFAQGDIRRRELLSWIKAIDVPVHAEFLKQLESANRVSRYNFKQDDLADRSDGPRKIDHREKVSMAKIITALAIDGYGYDPEAKKSPIPSEVENVAAKLGLNITDDTIRLYLKLGAQHLPKDWKTE